MKLQSQNYPEYLSQKSNQEDDSTSNSIIPPNHSIFQKEYFKTLDIIGNFQRGFILTHHLGKLYMIDQHAASQKSLFEQNRLKPNKKYPQKTDITIKVLNIYRQILQNKKEYIQTLGWDYQLLQQRHLETQVRITRSPIFYGIQQGQEQFVNIIDQIYLGQQLDYSNPEIKAIASFACHNAYKVGDDLSNSQMRGLVDSLYKMGSPFNCPHGRGTIHCIGIVKQIQEQIQQKKQYNL